MDPKSTSENPNAVASRLGRWRAEVREYAQKPHVQIGLIVFLITLLSFGAGYLLGRDFSPAPIVIEQNNEL